MAPKKSAAQRQPRPAAVTVETTRHAAPTAVTRRRTVSFEDAKNTTAPTPSTVAKNATAAAVKRAGIVEAKSSASERKRKRVTIEEDDAASLIDDSDASSNASVEAGLAEDLDDVADAMSSSSHNSGDADSDNPFVRARREEGATLSYPAVRLRFLPPEFQEPQLFKFLGQFGANVLNAFCVRSRRTHQSKGIAYVQFDTPAVIPLIVEECHGMSLGGRAVHAKAVTLHRAMPSKEKVSRRRKLADAYKTGGAPLKHHNVSKKSPVALLVKAARTEKHNNAHLKELGIDFTTDFFASQIARIPPALIAKGKVSMVAALGSATTHEEEKPQPATPPTMAASPPAKSNGKSSPAAAKKAAAVSPKKVATVVKASTPDKKVLTPKHASPAKSTTPKKAASPKK